MAPLDRASGAVGIEERDAFAALVSAARIGDAVAAGGTKSPAQSLAGGVAIVIERLVEGPGAVSEVMGDKFDIEHDLAKLGRSEEHTSELQSLMRISYAVFCLKKKKQTKQSSYK